MVNRLGLAGVALVGCMAAACATGRAIPRPFPGAALPPSAAEPVAARPVPPASPEAADVGRAEAAAEPGAGVIATALLLRGTPYRNGGADLSGFDCSGFVRYVFAQHGRPLPRDVRQQFTVGARIARDGIQPGDLVFFETVSRGASHVGIALGGDTFVHAPSSRGVVRVERYSSDYWAKRFVGARRVIEAE